MQRRHEPEDQDGGVRPRRHEQPRRYRRRHLHRRSTSERRSDDHAVRRHQREQSREEELQGFGQGLPEAFQDQLAESHLL